MSPDPEQVVGAEAELGELDQVLGPKGLEAVKHPSGAPAGESFEAGLTVHGSEELLGPVDQDRVDAPEPVALLDVREVRERLPPSPRLRPLVGLEPPLRQSAERRAERGRRTGQDLARLRQRERHDTCSRSALAAKTKSASFSPSILCVHTVRRTFPHAR